MQGRFSEYKIKQQGQEFLFRRRYPPIWQLLAMFIVGGGGIAALALTSPEWDHNAIFIVLALGILVLLSWYTIFITRLNRDILLATEFQNALFASATSLNSQFCLITKSDGTIVYYDPGFQTLFPEFLRMEQRAIDVLLRVGNASDADRDKITRTLIDSRNEHFMLTLSDSDGKQTRIMLSIDPLPRPRGFFLLRGREYIEKRQGAAPALTGPHGLENLPVGIYSIDATGRFTYVNKLLEKWLAFGEGELMGGNLKELVLPEERGDEPATGAYSGPLTMVNKNGALVPVVLTQSPGGEGTATGIVQLAPKDAAQKKTPELSTPSNYTYSAHGFIEHSPIAIAQLDNTGQVIEANRAFYDLVEREVTRTPWPLSEIIGQAGHKEFGEVLARALQGEVTNDAHAVELELPEGRNRTATVYITLMETESGRLPLVHLIDTTEQKNLEMRFAHSQKMQAVGQLAGGIAHDFNNLLTAMIGFCDLLLMRHPAGDQSFADIMQIKQNANRAANLVRQLLAFSRRQTLQPKLLDITDMLAELSNLVRRLIGENIELKMAHGRDLGMLKVDQGQFEQVIINLAVNARDAMPVGGTLIINTRNVTVDSEHPLPPHFVTPSEEDVIQPGDYILCEIADTGTGIKTEILQKIFEPFFSTKEVGHGTGLGLATVYGIVKQTGGYIYVESAPGAGTSFHLYFPRMAPEEISKAQVQEAAKEVAMSDLTGRGTVLLVEDETPVRIFAGRALRNKGYTVLEADSGEQGLELIQKEEGKIDIIISDVIMPGMTGPQMVEKIHALYPGIRVIFISGYAEDAFADSVKESADFNFLPKPFTLKQLAGKVKDVLGI